MVDLVSKFVFSECKWLNESMKEEWNNVWKCESVNEWMNEWLFDQPTISKKKN